MKNNKNIKIAFLIMIIAAISLFVKMGINHSRAEIIASGTKVQPHSELTYYLNVKYDGVDKFGVKSSDNVSAEMISGNLVVTDKIPTGLEFQGFVETNDGSIGAITRDDGSVCSGRVIDDTGDTVGWNEQNTEFVYHGLHYNKETNEVTFKVKNLKAGCVLTVGITTMTPTIDNPETEEKETRRDFYNFANAFENDLSINSNITHIYMGEDNVTRYNVSYEYTGTVPEGAPDVPAVTSYINGETVLVASDATLGGYTFSGWSSSDVTPSNNSFTMPEQNVVFRGSFEKKDTYKVNYTIEGVKPDNYILPGSKEYYEGATIKLDRLKVGDRIGIYEFLGWETSDVTLDEDKDFEMPNRVVNFVGRFREVKHTITYKFYEDILPPNADSLLPETKEYHVGDKVKLSNPRSVDGYEFLGWYYDDSFEMPDEDLIIYGEWKRKSGEFTPKITKTIDGKKTLYNTGETIKFNITIKNNESYDIKDVVIKELDDKAIFKDGKGYTKETDHIVKIDTIQAGKSFTIPCYVKVSNNMSGNYTNTVQIIGAFADNYYELSKSDIKASATYSVSKKTNIDVPITGKNTILIIIITALILLFAIGCTISLQIKKK